MFGSTTKVYCGKHPSKAHIVKTSEPDWGVGVIVEPLPYNRELVDWPDGRRTIEFDYALKAVNSHP